MATGASDADLALVLVGAEEGLTRQTKRHVVVLSMLGVRKVVLAVNKMDRVAWSEPAFRSIETQFRGVRGPHSGSKTSFHSGRGKSGDNIANRSDQAVV